CLWTIALIQEPLPRHAVYLGMSLGLAILAKAPGVLLLPAPLLSGLLFHKWGDRPFRKYLGGAYLLALGMTVVPLAAFFLRSEQGAGKSCPGPLHVTALGLALHNGPEACAWLWTYWSPPLALLGLAGLALGVGRRDRGSLLLALFTFLPVIAFVAVCRS